MTQLTSYDTRLLTRRRTPQLLLSRHRHRIPHKAGAITGVQSWYVYMYVRYVLIVDTKLLNMWTAKILTFFELKCRCKWAVCHPRTVHSVVTDRESGIREEGQLQI
jgi:hypothetical protein